MMEPARVARSIAPISRCDTEPIHVPGAVQSHGGLLVIDPADGRIAYRSENLAALLGLRTDPLGSSVAEVLGTDAMASIALAADASTEDVIPALIVLASGTTTNVMAHRSDGLMVVEFELPEAGDQEDALLHALRQAVQRIEGTLQGTEACDAAVEEVRRISGYDRVMIYRFHEDDHGEVVSEARRDDVEPYLGLHYPASDIPHPARRLLRLSPTRLIADVASEPVAIAGHGRYAGRPLDLSRSALRAVSPIHLEYLRNMGVAASLTISLTDGPRLWGLLACHHGAPLLPSPELRSACAIIARTLWLKVDAWEQLEEHAQHRGRLSLRAHFLANVSSVDSLAEALVEDGRFLLDLVGADGVYLRIDDVSTMLGETPAREDVESLVENLAALPGDPPFVTDEVGALLPQSGVAGAAVAGLIAAPVSASWQEYVIWFRGEAVRTVTWAGDPSKSLRGPAPAREEDGADAGDLRPRSSFAAWRETMRGHSVPWSRSDCSAASDLVSALADLRATRVRDALAKLALRDSLTGLPNRALLLDRIGVAIADLGRSGRTAWVMFLDLDGFKAVNDTLGHDAGDQLLIEVGARLRHGVRASDTVARLGGDEFVVLCSGGERDDRIDTLADALIASLAETIIVDGQPCRVSASIGIAEVDRTATPADVLRAADAAMYRAKRAGRNRSAR